MPKIIENIRETAIAESRKVLENDGYNKLTMRDIAAKCGIAVGTMYNYFESKEYLTGCVILEDWQTCYKDMQEATGSSPDTRDGLKQIYRLMGDFVSAHQYLASVDRSKAQGIDGYEKRHSIVLGHMTSLLDDLFSRFSLSIDPLIRTVIAELILNMSEKHYDYSEIEPVLIKLLET